MRVYINVMIPYNSFPHQVSQWECPFTEWEGSGKPLVDGSSSHESETSKMNDTSKSANSSSASSPVKGVKGVETDDGSDPDEAVEIHDSDDLGI